MKRDDIIFDIIEKEHQRQLKGIELIASENFVSDQVMQAMGSCLTNKYAEGYPGKRYYGGCEVVDQSEQIAIDRLKEIFGAEWANVQPHSGAQANAAVFLAVLNPGDKFMGLNLAHGGHLSHGSLVNTSGIIYTPCEYNLNQETGRVDYDQMEEVADKRLIKELKSIEEAQIVEDNSSDRWMKNKNSTKSADKPGVKVTRISAKSSRHHKKKRS